MTISRHLRPVSLREDFARSSSPLRVDRDQGVIYGVKILGFESVNGMDGMPKVQRRVYPREVVTRAQGLYEGLHVSIDHPKRAGEQRSAYDRFGKLTNINIRPDGLYGDLHYLKTHPLAERIVEAAERMPDAFGLSHSAEARGEPRGDAFVVTEITNVTSVDLVADPATTNGLFESRKGTNSMSPKQQKAVAALLQEMGYGKAPAMEDDMMAEEPGWEEHLGNAISAILMDDGIDMAEKKKKVMHLLNTWEKGGEAEEDEKDDMEKEANGSKKTEEGDDLQDDAEHAKGEDSGPPKGKAADNKLTKESLQALRASSDPAVRQLLERVDRLETKAKVQSKLRKAHQFIEAAKLPKEAVSDIFLDQLVSCPDVASMRKLVEDRRALVMAKRPRSLGKTPGGEIDAKQFAKLLRNGAA